MLIGIPKEVKERENRVSMIPAGIQVLTNHGHTVFVEQNAGLGACISNEAFRKAGAQILETAEEVWDKSQLIVKVKEPIPQEYDLMKPKQILYTYLHLAAEPELTRILLEKEITAIAYETIELEDGSLPLLRPMSEVAGRMSVQVGCQCLERDNNGKGVLLGGVPGVQRGRVSIIGAGVVGLNAAKMAIGLGANVTILDINQTRLAYLDDIFGNKITTLVSNPETIYEQIRKSDLVVGAVLVTGAKAPKLITTEMIKGMEPGSVIVDVAIDQGGSVENVQKTSHSRPTYENHGVNIYAVTNMPGKVPRTSTYALTNATFKYTLQIANKGVQSALEGSQPLKKGLNTFGGKICYHAVREALNNYNHFSRH